MNIFRFILLHVYLHREKHRSKCENNAFLTQLKVTTKLEKETDLYIPLNNHRLFIDSGYHTRTTIVTFNSSDNCLDNNLSSSNRYGTGSAIECRSEVTYHRSYGIYCCYSIMVNKHHVAGYDAFAAFMKDFDGNGAPINVLFTGAKMANGQSWCVDCVEAAPFIERAVETAAPKDSHFIYVDVGDRPTWKDMNNPFRKDKNTHLSVIPTLIRWKNPQRLEGEQCTKTDLLELFFSEED